MNILDSKVYTFIEFIINLLIINLLWLISCLPIITIGPATTALFAVVRDSVLYQETQIVKPYFIYFISYFKKSFVVGIILPILIGAITINLLYFLNLRNLIILPLFILFIVLIISGLTFLFPIIITYHISWIEIIKNSLLFSIMHFPITLINLCIIVISLYCILMYPPTIFCIFSSSAYLIFLLCNSAFKTTGEKLLLRNNS